MALFRRDFTKARMNLDVTPRLLPPGEYREATNIIVTEEEGIIRKSRSNKRLTNLQLGANPITLGEYSYANRRRIYWRVKSDSGCFLIEWDHDSQSASFVLHETRTGTSRVFDMHEDYLCTAIDIIPNDDPDKELILMTDDYMQPLCFNIARAKTWGENGFELDDILLIKKPPRFSPDVTLTYAGGLDNDIKEEFFSFFYRYRYLDGEYSAFSDMTNYQFSPGQFELDYQTLENLGMQNNFNAINIGFNTGDFRVTDVQLFFKKSNSDVPYLIETFNKELENWADEEDKTHLFSNNKLYTPLPTKELYRQYDNVPIRAKSQAVIGNMVNYANYSEGYDLLDSSNRKIKPDFSLSIISNDLAGDDVPYVLASPGTEIEGGLTLTFNLTGIELTTGARLRFNFIMKSVHTDGPDEVVSGSFDDSFDFILNRDFADAAALAADPDFVLFVETIIQNAFMANYSLTPPADSVLDTNTTFEITGSTATTITITGPVFTYEIDNTPENTEDSDFDYIDYEWHFFDTTEVNFRNFAVASSLKTNRSYEVGIIYKDAWKRSTTALTCATNTIYIPQSLSTLQNKLKVTLDNLPPAWADTYKFVVKQSTLSYYTIYAVLFYEDGPYRWVKLDGANKDKVKQGDVLILKADLAGAREDVFKVYVIEKSDKEVNFISGNTNPDGQEITEEAGTYMKIKAENISMNVSGSQYYYYNNTEIGFQSIELGTVMQFYDEGTEQWVDLPINAGSLIRIRFFCDPYGTNDATPKVVWEQEFTAANTYDNIEDWFDAEVTIPTEYISAFNIHFDRNLDTNKLDMVFTSLYPAFKNDIRATLAVQRTESIIIFETEPVVGDLDVYYETEESFLMTGGYHQGNIQNQNAVLPAIIELDFFNCYAFGNAAESYRVKDLMNKSFLNIDLKPTSTSIEPYGRRRRSADITYSEPYEESLGQNGLNVFNSATVNYKDDIDKQYGSIQKLYARENNILVFQENRTGYVLFNKNAIYTSRGDAAITSTSRILGDYTPYQGNRGIGTHPESFSVDPQGRVKYDSRRNGVIVRLSRDGIEDITYGISNFLKQVFRDQPNAKVISGYDPYLNQTVFYIGNEPVRLPQFGCSTNIIKSGQTDEFSYELVLNDLGGDIVFNYNITSGNATITVEFNGNTEVVSNVTGSGTVTMERDSLVENIVTITITPVSGAIDYTIINTCPIGTELKIVTLVLNDATDTGLTMTDRFKTTGSPFISTTDTFTAPPVTRFETITGLEGVGAFPSNGQIVIMQAFKDVVNTGSFATTNCNRMGYLITDTVYVEADYQDILDHPDTEFISVTTTGEEGLSETSAGNFTFSRTETDQILYLIFDYTDRNPVVSDDFANVELGSDVVINVLDNDEVSVDAEVTIATQPTYGTAVVNLDNTITYTHDGTDHFEDSFTYTVTEGGCSSTATVYITIGVTCGGSITAGGATGIYEAVINLGTDTGYAGIRINAQGVPDRFQIYWDDELVADTKFIGDSLLPGPPVSFAGLLGDHNLNVYEYIGSDFVDTGIDELITVHQEDIADNVTEPMDGNAYLAFNKTTATPTTVRLRVTGPSGTAWNLFDVICPTPVEDLVGTETQLYYGFFTEPDKGLATKSIGLVYNADQDRFFTNIFGQDSMAVFTGSSGFPWSSTNNYINDGTTWWRIDIDGNVLETGAL